MNSELLIFQWQSINIRVFVDSIWACPELEHIGNRFVCYIEVTSMNASSWSSFDRFFALYLLN